MPYFFLWIHYNYIVHLTCLIVSINDILGVRFAGGGGGGGGGGGPAGGGGVGAATGG